MSETSNLFDYIVWRGDLTLDKAPFTAVDGLILSAFSYVHMDSLIKSDRDFTVTVKDVANRFLRLPVGVRPRVRSKLDSTLLQLLRDSKRFGDMRIGFCRDVFDPDKETQFAAVTILLDESEALVAFRGTDATLVGWKEDFNMSFQEVVPAQLAAVDYLEYVASQLDCRLRVAGHSKGGNLAVFAASQCKNSVQDRIIAVYNNDGPGFCEKILGSEGYIRMLDKVNAFVPQDSVIGMLLDHGKAYTVVRSMQVGLSQHDPYTWTVKGPDFERLEEVTRGSRMTERVVEDWLESLTNEERGKFVDAVYELVTSGGASFTTDIGKLKNVLAAVKTYKGADESTKRMVTSALKRRIRSAVNAFRKEGGQEKQPAAQGKRSVQPVNGRS